jgi:hypothetical protein
MAFENILPSGSDFGGSSDTLLTISGLGVFQYQARGMTQELEHIRQSMDQERDINGNLLDLSNPAFRKYSTKLHCSDVDAPPWDNLWPGQGPITIQCAVSLCYEYGNPGSPGREVVSGSMYRQGNYVFYRPILYCLVSSYDVDFDEWKCTYSWSLSAEEV